MANIIDYVKWKGDASFADRPFNIVDNLVFSELSYLELPDTLFSEEPLTIRKVWEKLGENAKFRLVTSSNDEIELLKACALSERFSCVSISDYEDSCSDLQETQFAAMTFHLSLEEAFIAFRGTDDTILGWKEDFMLCYCKVPAQERALQYIEKMIAGGKRYYVGGHSKGANLALFGAAYLRNNKDSLIKVYLNDGPGFCNDVLDSNRISLIDDKSVRITPEYCVVGAIFQPEITEEYIVKSSAPQILQHDLLSWKTTPEGLDLAEGHDTVSVEVNSLFDTFIGKMDDLENRQAFVDSIFDTMTQNGAKTITDFLNEGPDAFENLIITVAGDNMGGRHPLKSVKENIASEVNNSFRGRFIPKNEKTKTILKIVAMILGAIMCFLVPNSLIQTVYALGIFIIVAYQVSRTVYYLYKAKWDIGKEKLRVNISIVLMVSYVVLILKDKALLLVSSIMFGIFFFICSFQCLAKYKACEEKSKKARYLFEMIMTALNGGYLLFAPSVELGWYMISLGMFMLIDAVFEIIGLIVDKTASYTS